jgi:hypothetical protein
LILLAIKHRQKRRRRIVGRKTIIITLIKLYRAMGCAEEQNFFSSEYKRADSPS